MKPYNKTLLTHLQNEHAKKLKELRELKVWRAEVRLPLVMLSKPGLRKVDRMHQLKRDIRKLSVQILRLKQPNLF